MTNNREKEIHNYYTAMKMTRTMIAKKLYCLDEDLLECNNWSMDDTIYGITCECNLEERADMIEILDIVDNNSNTISRFSML